MATLNVKHGGTWKPLTGLSVKDAGVWKTPVGAWVKSGGTWQQFWPLAGGGGATWNPADKAASVNLTNSNRTATSAASGYRGVRGTSALSSGKVHVEFRAPTSLSAGWAFGIGEAAASLVFWMGSSNNMGIYRDGTVWRNGASQGTAIPAGFVAGTVQAMEVDFGTKDMKFWNGTAWSTPLTFTPYMTGPWYLMWTTDTSGNDIEINTGQSAFVITPSSGYGGWA